VTGISRPVPRQVVPRPATWRPGVPAPWAGVAAAARREITVARVLDAFGAHGQRGPVPDSMSTDPLPEPAVVLNGPAPPTQYTAAAAAVLTALFEEEGEARVILTRRSTSLRAHRGEISFPGGRLDPGESPRAAALREAHEEIALHPDLVTVEGWLHPVLTVATGSLVMPIVATVAARPHLVASPAEVERVFDVTLRELADSENFHEERWCVPGRHAPGIPDGSFAVWFFEVEGEMIWGATARMLYELLSVVLLPPS
jgi:8-oxo-dGTP pyrophosphatase MutT (NUDIX family)